MGRMLLVEDDKLMAATLLACLEEVDAEVDHFISAEDALTAFIEKPYDLVMVDFMLPGMTGIDLLNRISESDHSYPKTILYTGMQERELPSERPHLDRYFRKPIPDFMEVVDAIEELLS